MSMSRTGPKSRLDETGSRAVGQLSIQKMEPRGNEWGSSAPILRHRKAVFCFLRPLCLQVLCSQFLHVRLQSIARLPGLRARSGARLSACLFPFPACLSLSIRLPCYTVLGGVLPGSRASSSTFLTDEGSLAIVRDVRGAHPSFRDRRRHAYPASTSWLLNGKVRWVPHSSEGSSFKSSGSNWTL